MSFGEWLSERSPAVLASSLAAAVFAGLGAGAWLDLPAYISEPTGRGEPELILTDDPGRAKWNEVISSLGGLGSTFVIPAYFSTTPAADPPVFLQEDRELSQLLAQVDTQLHEGEARQAVWTREQTWSRQADAEQDREAWPVRDDDGRYAQPRYASVGYVETPTTEVVAPVEQARYEPPPRYRPPPRYEPAYAPAYSQVYAVEADEPVPPPPPRPSTW